MKTVCWGVRNVPEELTGDLGSRTEKIYGSALEQKLHLRGSFQLKARERAFILQQSSVSGSWPPLGKRKLQGTSCSLHTAAQAAQGQASEDRRKAGWLLEAKHTEAEGCICRNGNRAPRGIWSTHSVHHKNDLCARWRASTTRTESRSILSVSSAPARYLHMWSSVNTC